MSVVENLNQERRITFCLYEYWEKLAGENQLPALRDMNRAEIDPFKKNLVLMDLRNGQDQPTFQVIGQDLQEDLEGDLSNMPVSSVPRRTMLSRITDHYLEVLANRVPIAFEAEFVNSEGEKALYRGILLPFSDDNKNINFILGGVRWILEKDVTLDDGKPTIEELMRSIADGRKGRPKVTDKEPVPANIIDETEDKAEVVLEEDNIDPEPEQSFETNIETNAADTEEILELGENNSEDLSSTQQSEEVMSPPSIEDLLAADADSDHDELILEEEISSDSDVISTEADTSNEALDPVEDGHIEAVEDIHPEELSEHSKSLDLDDAVETVGEDVVKADETDEIQLENEPDHFEVEDSPEHDGPSIPIDAIDEEPSEVEFDENNSDDLTLTAEEASEEDLIEEQAGPVLELTEEDLPQSENFENHLEEKEPLSESTEEEATTLTGNVFDRIIPVPKQEAKSLTRKDFSPESKTEEFTSEAENKTTDDLSIEELGGEPPILEDNEATELDISEDVVDDNLEVAGHDTTRDEDALSLVDKLEDDKIANEFSIEKDISTSELTQSVDEEILDDNTEQETDHESIEPLILEEDIISVEDNDEISSEPIDTPSLDIEEENPAEELSDIETIPSAEELEEINALLTPAEDETATTGIDAEHASSHPTEPSEGDDDDLSIEELMQSILSERKFDLAYPLDPQVIEEQTEDEADITSDENVDIETTDEDNSKEEGPEAEIDTDVELTSHEEYIASEIEEVTEEAQQNSGPQSDEVEQPAEMGPSETGDTEPETSIVFEPDVIEDDEPATEIEENIEASSIADEVVIEPEPQQSSDDDLIVSEDVTDDKIVGTEDEKAAFTETEEPITFEALVDEAIEEPSDEIILDTEDTTQAEMDTIDLSDSVEKEGPVEATEVGVTEEWVDEKPQEADPILETAEEPQQSETVETFTSNGAFVEPAEEPERKGKGSVIERAMAMMTPGFNRPKETALDTAKSVQNDDSADENTDNVPEIGTIEISQETVDNKEPIAEELSVDEIAPSGSVENIIVSEDETRNSIEDVMDELEANEVSVQEETLDIIDEPLAETPNNLDLVEDDDHIEITKDNDLDISEGDILLDPEESSFEDELVKELLDEKHPQDEQESLEEAIPESDLILAPSEAEITEESPTQEVEEETAPESNIQETETSADVEDAIDTEGEDYEPEENELSVAELKSTLKQVVGYIKKEDANHNRSRDSLYNILTAIYEFHQTCESSPESYDEIVNEAGLKVQSRAPYTPVLKICLGKDYDKTRLTEYAAALGIAKYMDVEVDEFHDFIKNFPGGIKGCVKEMRIIRKHGASGNVMARKTKSVEEARAILRDMAPIASFRLKKVIVGNNVDEFCLLLAKRDGHDINVLKIIDDKYTKLDPIIKRTAFIKGNLNDRK